MVTRDHISIQTSGVSFISHFAFFALAPCLEQNGISRLLRMFKFCLVGQACPRVLFFAPKRCHANVSFPYSVS